MLEKYTAQGLFRKQFLILVVLSKHVTRKGYLVPSARLAEFYSQKLKVTFMCLLSDINMIIVHVNNGRVEGFTI